MNKLSEGVIEKIRVMVRAGASNRAISGKIGIARGTTTYYQRLFRNEAPTCQHGKLLYDCSSCCSCRRVISENGIVWLRGPRPGNGRNSHSKTQEHILLKAMQSILDDIRKEKHRNRAYGPCNRAWK